jgi:hypothetical protein
MTNLKKKSRWQLGVCNTLASIMIQHEAEDSVTCQRGFVHVNAIWLLNGTPNTL